MLYDVHVAAMFNAWLVFASRVRLRKRGVECVNKIMTLTSSLIH